MNKNFLSEFKNPSSEHRGAPFWAWNCKLDKDKMLEQIDYFKEMGLGGFTMHTRTGLATEYLGKEYMDVIKACVKKAEKLGMKAYLYDEDRWPSGAAGGRVTKNIKYRARHLLFTPVKRENADNLVAAYDVKLNEGYLSDYKRVGDAATGKNLWYAYLDVDGDHPWYNNQSYVDTLNKEAIEEFVKNTHEIYNDAVGEYFGTVIPSIFTDEPQFTHKTTFGRADEKRDMILPYTDDFEDTFKAQYGVSLLDSLPELFWELPDNRVSVTRYHYHDHLAERFACAFSDTVGGWCRKHNIALTGHMMMEDTLGSQTAALGEAMRNYRSFDVPGIDTLCDARLFVTAKQAQSAAHQMGVNDITSELYGVTNWDFDFRGHKLQGDWEAAMGITRRVHHLAWASMAGESKRDYPASIFYQSPWYKKYSAIEDYFARVNTAMRSGTPDIHIGIIHPVESYWLHFGPQEQTGQIRNKMESRFRNITDWLSYGLIDYNLISEALMLNLGYDTNDGFSVGKMKYDVVIVPGCETLRRTTYNALRDFTNKGGRVIFMGEYPKYIDALPIDEPVFFEKCELVDFDNSTLMNTLESSRFIDIRNAAGMRTGNYIHQIRNYNDSDKLVFIANGGQGGYNKDVPSLQNLRIIINGEYSVELLDAVSGERKKLHCEYINGKTVLHRGMYEQDSLLLNLTRGRAAENPAESTDEHRCICALNDVFEYSMSEPNVLLLDSAEYSLDNEPFSTADEVLRADNIIRRKLCYPLKTEAFPQPWIYGDNIKTEHTVTLRYAISSEEEMSGCSLAMEDVQLCDISFNGEKVSNTPFGWFTDESIKTVSLPDIHKGDNILVVKIPFNLRSNVEWCYILGDFGVQVCGNRAIITKKPEKVGCCDLSLQRFPFYGGNFTYTFEHEFEDGEYELEITKFRCPVISVAVDGKDAGEIMISPYRVKLGHLCGKKKITVTAYGNRINTFGQVHCADEWMNWFGPDSWRTGGAMYSNEYQLKRTGLLTAPNIIKVK